MAKNALIVGPPRTGTSLAASIFVGAGYYRGPIAKARDRLGDDHNPFGYFEADAVIERNVDVLRRVGFRSHNTWTTETLPEATADAIGGLAPTDADRAFVRGYGARAPWLWKDPRLCYTLSYWWKMMDPDETVVVLVHRDPVDVYHSFRRKEWCGAGTAARQATLALVQRHYAAAERAVGALGIPHVRLDYADYGRNLPAVAERLAAAFDVALSAQGINYRRELDRSDLRGRLSGLVRRQLKRLPRAPVKRLARLVPRRLLALIFPERLHTRHDLPRRADEGASRAGSIERT